MGKLGESSRIGVERKDEILGKLSQGSHILECLRNGSTLWKTHVIVLCELNLKKRVTPEGEEKPLIFLNVYKFLHTTDQPTSFAKQVYLLLELLLFYIFLSF